MLNFQRNLSRSFLLVLGLPSTGMGFALSVQIATLSWILSTQYSLPIDDVGFVWAAGPLAGIVGQLSIGWLSDKTWFWGGRRRPYLIIGGVLASLSLVALPNIGVISVALHLKSILAVAIIVALVLDLSINVSLNPARSIIADVTPEGIERTKGFTWMQSLSGLFAVLAYGIGAIWNNYVLIYSSVFVVFVLCVFPPLLIEEPRHFETKKQVTGLSVRDAFFSIRPLWGFMIYDIWAMSVRLLGIEIRGYWPEIICGCLTIVLVFSAIFRPTRIQMKREASCLWDMEILLAANAFSWIGIQTMFVYLVAYAQAKLPGASDLAIGRIVVISMLILNGMAAIFPAFILKPCTERIGRVRTHVIALACMTLGYLTVAWIGSTPSQIYWPMALIGVGWAAVVSLPFAIVSEKVQRTQTGLYMGIFGLSIVLPQLAVSLGLGTIIGRAADKGIIFYICALSLAISAACWAAVKEQSPDELLPG